MKFWIILKYVIGVRGEHRIQPNSAEFMCDHLRFSSLLHYYT